MGIFDSPGSSVSWKIHPEDFKNFVKQLQGLGHIISDPNMQLYRAQKYKEFTIQMVRDGMLGLKALSDLTQAISGNPHPPVWNTGNVVESMAVKPVGKKAAEAGYWDSVQGKMPDKKISMAAWVRMLHTGFRIPLTGEKGRKVRGFLFSQKITTFLSSENTQTNKKGNKWLNVSPRPFMMKAYDAYIYSGKDLEAVDEFLNKMANSQIDTTRGRGKKTSV